MVDNSYNLRPSEGLTTEQLKMYSDGYHMGFHHSVCALIHRPRYLLDDRNWAAGYRDGCADYDIRFAARAA